MIAGSRMYDSTMTNCRARAAASFAMTGGALQFGGGSGVAVGAAVGAIVG